jgi:hypothetical protein
MSRFGNGTAILMVAGLALGCSEDSKPGGSDAGLGGAGMGPAVSFADDIHPILVMKCGTGECHGLANNAFQPGHGSTDVEVAYAQTQRMSNGAPVYERILARTSGMDSFGFMPPETFGPMPCQGALDAEGCLTTEEYELIQAWVAQGTPP